MKCDRWAFATHILAIGARQLFPCWDNPQYKTAFTISMQHSRNFTALSNMPIQRYFEINETDTDYTWTHFHITPPISTYQVAIAVTNYTSIRVNENVALWYRKGFRMNFLEFAKQVIKNITLYLKSEFKVVDIPKMDHVVIPNFPQDGTSKLGLIFYR